MIKATSPIIHQIRATMQNNITSTSERVKIFFKTNKGEYAEGDNFIGVTVPNLRKIAKDFPDLTLGNIRKLLQAKINEERLLALFILVNQYKRAEAEEKETLYQFYLQNLKHVNNWNLVDASCHFIIGEHLWDKDKEILFTLAKSDNLWKRRISIVATWAFIRKDKHDWTFKIARTLLEDKHDLIHKAVGWMLRETGKRNEKALIDFLEQNAKKMPRTMLRYAIERFSDEARRNFRSLKTT